MPSLALLTNQNERYRELLANAHLPGMTFATEVAQADIWLADPALAAEQLASLPPPAWLASTYAGVNALLAPGLPKDYCLTHVRRLFGPLMSEYVFGHLLSHLRHLPQLARQQRQRQWQTQPYASLAGTTLVTLGTGDIARHIATVARAFGMTVLGVSRSGEAREEFDAVCRFDDANATLNRAQVLVSVLPDTAETRGLLDATVLQQLPAGCLLFNVGRGSAIDEAALLQALDADHIAHAFLDVFKQEPLPADHPFWHHPGISVTPHVAAVSLPEQVCDQVIDNYYRFVDGRPLLHQFQWQRGY
ncbi:D-2-hydroxyacid dehydrogenase [Ferrimonas sp. SCSIO 43195]|uniref:D-2-hydroxyacid dehydrogenase n=1 Tax=Ferrimonas sp. SCSIO 43195 TaxID=2822844 RepID=UPI0020756CE7|nr:D-2-hydroxyacid dehydrogenase [Ferrimonas sp. SCSIO 43195]USD37106.1 D-2-hydroxyacid dehydrogenase [Ferrimonas sp. SCSIO 43195]